MPIIIDDFFNEANGILKDSQLREIARIRNENAVEVTKLKKEIKKVQEMSQYNYGQMAKENLKARSNHGSMGADNEVEMQKRQLQQENAIIKDKLRAAETLLSSGTNERVKFMEGASWIAMKAHQEADRHTNKMNFLIHEFETRTRSSVVDEKINDFDGKKVIANKDWIANELHIESRDL